MSPSPSPSPAEGAAGTAPSTRRLALPSRNALWVAGALLALASLIPVWPAFSHLLVAALVLALVAAGADLYARLPHGAIRARRVLQPIYHLGRESHYELLLENASDRRIALEVREVLPPALEGAGLRERSVLAPRQELRFRVPFVAVERGPVALPPLGLRAGHPLGLIDRQESRELQDQVRVAPGRPSGEIAWLLSRASALEVGERRTRALGGEWEFESLREYVPGDELRRIDWKASARRSQPRVRQYRAERSAELLLALDCGRLMGSLVSGLRKLDLAMTPLLDVAAVALRRGERVGLLAFDSRPRVYLPPRGDLAQLGAMTAALAALPGGEEPTSYLRAVRHLEARHKKRTLVVVFTDFTDEISAEEMRASLAALARRHALLVAAVADPHVEQIFREPGRGEQARFEQAVAGQLLLERERTLAALARAGVIAVDAEPRKLSGPLLQRYLELRLAGAA